MKKLIVAVAVGLMALPVGTAAAKKGPATTCVPVPVAIDTYSVKVQGQTVRVGGRSNTKVCVTHDTDVAAAPLTTFGQNCGILCFSVRLDNVRAYEDLKVEVSWREDGLWKSVTVDPDPVDVTRDLTGTCISSHQEGSADPCGQ